MAPTEKQLISEIHKIVLETAKKQEILEKEIQKIHQKLESLSNSTTSTETKEIQEIHKKLDSILKPTETTHTVEREENEKEIDEQKTSALINYFEENYGHLKQINDRYIKEEAYRAKKQNLTMWKTLLNNRKMNFYNAIKSTETAKTYNTFLEMEEIYIPRKFREKTTKQDSEEQTRIKTHLNIAKVSAHIKILEDKATNYTNKFLQVDEEIITEIKDSCPIETLPFLSDLWKLECESEEEKSKEILKKKMLWLTNLPNWEKEKEKEKQEKELRNGNKQTEHQQTSLNTHSQPGQNTRQLHPNQQRNKFQYNQQRNKFQNNQQRNKFQNNQQRNKFQNNVPNRNNPINTQRESRNNQEKDTQEHRSYADITKGNIQRNRNNRNEINYHNNEHQNNTGETSRYDLQPPRENHNEIHTNNTRGQNHFLGNRIKVRETTY